MFVYLVANSFVEMKWKKMWISSTMVLSCFISGLFLMCNQLLSDSQWACPPHILHSIHTIYVAKANELCKYSGMTKLSDKPLLYLLFAFLWVCSYSVFIFRNLKAAAMWMTIYKLSTPHSMYINRLIPFIGIYYLGRQFAANALFVLFIIYKMHTNTQHTQYIFLWFYGLAATFCVRN